MKNKEKNQRCKEFLSCLGNGKTIYQIEAEEESEQEKCLCNEGIMTGKEFDCACKIHQGEE